MIYTRQVCSMAHALDKLPCQPIILPSTLPMHCRQLIRSAMKGRSIVMCIFHCVQFSAECSPPVLARKAMFMRSGFSGFACELIRICFSLTFILAPSFQNGRRVSQAGFDSVFLRKLRRMSFFS